MAGESNFGNGLSGGGLLYFHAFDRFSAIQNIPTINLKGTSGMTLTQYGEGGPGGE